ncbi:3TM-type holin [Magnetospirillum aberrantis]|uniref:Uncharacterized protein n=1 Tax=Magnetospirillum aberrantis SpK TaxID=908842 RepID=A0A7C9QT37_9PROT|nr:3TM-type holin [Magnetospirillum aberrantis]NFV79983.1 hypothetical protein [Magnetospirillum aberrantis SpK]
MGIGSILGDALGGAASGAASPITAIAGLGGKIIDRLWPDPTQAAQAKLELLKMQQSGELQEMATISGLDLAQIEVNKIEAASSSLFVAGWRPAIGWVCAASLAVYYIPRFAIGTGMWVWACFQATPPALVPLPEMGIADILGLVGSLLGMSFIRMREKERGVAR